MQQMISIDNLKVVISIASPFLAAYLASHWALTKHNKEKQWERKQKAYKEIIDSLYDLLQYCEVKKEDYGQGTIVQKGIMNELSNKDRKSVV